MADRKPFLLRLDAKLFRDLQAWAEQEMRSVNGQIEFILRHAVAKRRGRDVEPSGEDGGDGARDANAGGAGGRGPRRAS